MMSADDRRVRQRTTLDNDDGGAGASGGGSGTPPSSDECTSVALSISTQLGLQFDNPVLSDVTLVWADHHGQRRCFHCHKVVLASMSTYFHALFTAGMQESTAREVVLKDVDGDLMELVLRLLYGFAEEITPQNILVFMHLADFCARIATRKPRPIRRLSHLPPRSIRDRARASQTALRSS